MKRIKRPLLMAAGLCWLGFAAGIGLILIQYFTDGAGLQVFHLFSVLTVALSLGQVIGLAAAAFVCFAIGMLLCLHALVPVDCADEQAGNTTRM